MRGENEQMMNPESRCRGKLSLRKETIKDLNAHDFSRNLAVNWPSDSYCSECNGCIPITQR